MKGDAGEGRVELSLDDERYTRALTRGERTVATNGDPVLDDPTEADRFAFLLGTNEARQAVGSDTDIREVILKPVDTDDIEAEIDRLQSERERIKGEQSEIADLQGELPELERRRRGLAEQIDQTLEELDAERTELYEADADVDETRDEKAELDAKLEELRNARETEVRHGRGTTTKETLEFHVVRRTADGETHEDRVGRISESEREVTGVVFALAGYLAHEMYEEVPFLFLDSLEAIDSGRIAILIESVRDYADFVVIALLP